jgi:hypothetical protein
MTQFDDRERAFEKKFGLDEEFRFKNDVRAAKLFGLWAAGQMGMAGAEAETYAVQLSEIAVGKVGHEHLIVKVEQDFKAKGMNFTRHRLEKEMGVCDDTAYKRAAG